MRSYLVRLEGLRLLLVQARGEKHLKKILRETGEKDAVISWVPYDGPVVVQLELPATLGYGKSGKVRSVKVQEMLPDLAERVPLIGYVRADDRVQAQCAAAMLDAVAPNAGSVIMAAYRRAEDGIEGDEVSIEPRHLRAAIREDLRGSGELVGSKGAEVPRLNLYWVETADHDEDWFVVAASQRDACRYHEGAEGYAEGDASAEFLAVVPDDAPDRSEGWPSDALLTSCGAVIDRATTPRVVRLGGRTFAEGMLESEILATWDDQSEKAGRGRPNATPRRSTGS